VIYYFVGDFITDKDRWYSVSPLVFQIIMGALALICALFIKRGAWGSVSQRFPGLQLVALQRRLVLSAATSSTQHLPSPRTRPGAPHG
jgi:uncharacterized membrane protein